MHALTLPEIAALTGCKLPLDSRPDSVLISGVASLAEAATGDISFLGNAKYTPAARRTRASAIFAPFGFSEQTGCLVLQVENPSLAFAQVVAHFTPPSLAYEAGIHPTAVVAPSATIAETASIQPYAVIEAGAHIKAGAIIGAHCFIGRHSVVGTDCWLHPSVTLRERTLLGARVQIHSGTVIGSDGFGYEKQNGEHIKVPQVGFVQIDDDVEIGANVAVDRARFGRTWIRRGTKIDNLVQIAHNVVLGEHCLVASQTGISGSARLGNYVTLAGQVGVVGHVEVGDEVLVMAKSGISKDTPAKSVLFGMIGGPIEEERVLLAHYRRLPKMVARLKALEAEMASLRTAMSEMAAATTDASV